jgi:hypothetical protein
VYGSIVHVRLLRLRGKLGRLFSHDHRVLVVRAPAQLTSVIDRSLRRFLEPAMHILDWENKVVGHDIVQRHTLAGFRVVV